MSQHSNLRRSLDTLIHRKSTLCRLFGCYPEVDKKGMKACVSKRFGADAVKMFNFEIQGAGGASKMIAGSILQSLVRTGGRDEGVQTECRVKDSILCPNQTFSQADTLVPVDSFGSIQANQSFPRTLIIHVYQT